MFYQETQYGFDYGPAKITRMFSDEKQGWVTIGVRTEKRDLQVYVTKTGKVRIFDSTGEWQCPLTKQKSR